MRLCNHKICKFRTLKITKLADLAKDLERYFTELQRLNAYLRTDKLKKKIDYPKMKFTINRRERITKVRFSSFHFPVHAFNTTKVKMPKQIPSEME